MYDLRLGRWQDREPIEVDCIICDPPYSERTHTGANSGRRIERGLTAPGKGSTPGKPIRQIDYGHLSAGDVYAIVTTLAPRNRGWWAILTDHTLAPIWFDAFESVGLYSFAPVPCVIPGMTCRLAGDGPSSWAVFLMVARPKRSPFSKWGTLPGAYISTPGDGSNRGAERIGGKPLALMSQIVRDYSREGDTVYDPFAGHATTGVAALQLGRHFVGDECDAGAHAAGLARLQRVVAQPSLFEAKTKAGSLFDSP